MTLRKGITVGVRRYASDVIDAPRYPQSAEEMRAAAGLGVWSAGWACDELSGALAPLFGGVTLSAVGTPTYGHRGVVGSRAIRLPSDGGNHHFSGGDNFDAGASDDVAMLWVGRCGSNPASSRVFFGKRGIASAYYSVQIGTGASGAITLVCHDGATSYVSNSATAAGHIGTSYHIGIAVVERGAVNQGRVGTDLVVAAASSIGALGSMQNTAAVGLGRPGSVAPDFYFDAAYLAVGVNAASGLVSGLASAIASFKSYVGFP